MKSEKEFQEAVVGNISARWSHVESAISPGYPDLSYTILFTEIGDHKFGTRGHIELKFSSVRRSAFLRPSQKRWFEQDLDHGGRPMVWTATRDRVLIHAVPDIRAVLKGRPTHLEWITTASDWVPLNHPRLWEILKCWMFRPSSDGRSIWDPERQDG